MIKNDNGDIALKYFQPVQTFIDGSTLPSKIQGYVFTVQANISLCWVKESDLQNMLNRKRRGCASGGCGGHAPAFMYANDNDVRQWTNKGGR